MKTIFGDAYYFLAIGSARDQGHERAMNYAVNYTGRALTTEWVLTEVADALSSPAQRVRFLQLINLIEADENWIVVESSHELFERGMALFFQRADKSWSLTGSPLIDISSRLASFPSWRSFRIRTRPLALRM